MPLPRILVNGFPVPDIGPADRKKWVNGVAVGTFTGGARNINAALTIPGFTTSGSIQIVRNLDGSLSIPGFSAAASADILRNLTGAPSIPGFTTSGSITITPAAFNPLTDIPGLTLFLDADNLSAGSIATFTNTGSAGGTFTAAGSAQPTCTAGSVNGHKSLDFDGTDDIMQSAKVLSDFMTDSADTVWAAVQVTSCGTNIAPGSGSYSNAQIFGDASGYRWVGCRSNNNAQNGIYDASEKVAAVTNTLNIGGGTWLVLEGRHESGTLYFSRDGANENNTSCGTIDVLTAQTRLGAGFGGAKLGMKLHCLAISNQAVSSGTRLSMRNWLYNRLGITGS